MIFTSRWPDWFCVSNLPKRRHFIYVIHDDIEAEETCPVSFSRQTFTTLAVYAIFFYALAPVAQIELESEAAVFMHPVVGVFALGIHHGRKTCTMMCVPSALASLASPVGAS